MPLPLPKPKIQCGLSTTIRSPESWRFHARRFDLLDWRVASFAVVAADALVFKFAHLILPFTLAAFAWVLGITLGTQTRGAAAWLAHRFGRRA